MGFALGERHSVVEHPSVEHQATSGGDGCSDAGLLGLGRAVYRHLQGKGRGVRVLGDTQALAVARVEPDCVAMDLTTGVRLASGVSCCGYGPVGGLSRSLRFAAW